MTFDEIMAEISGGLSGDPAEDLRFLKEKCEEYKNHECGAEILRACGRMIYELLPEEDRNAVDGIMKKYESQIQSTLEKAHELLFERQEPEKAANLLEALIEKISPLNSPHEDEQSIFVSLNDSLQEYLYLNQS